MTIREILVATDFSDIAEAAARVAGDLARQAPGRLHILHVVTPGEYRVTSLLAALAEQIGSGIEVATATGAGDPAEEIVKYAQRNRIDVIVVGTHGRTGISRLLLGSVAERVVRMARCPVLTVPGAEAAAVVPEESAPPPVSTRCLVCAKPSADLICEPCRAHIRGEALEHKQREERAGRL